MLRRLFVSSVRCFSLASRLNNAHLTLFTKDTCQLCTNAHGILKDTLKLDALANQKIELDVIDIMDPANEKWFDVYCYDVPVLHVDRPGQSKPVKFMHYFFQDKLLEELSK